MSRKGVLTVISGFSGVGKGTIVKHLLSKYNYALSISATSRSPREGEIDGREYFFLTKEEFRSKIKDNGFIEWAEYVENYYGTPRAYVEEKLKEGKDVILEIEPQGAMKVKEQYPDACLIFIVPPCAKELRDRLVNRGTDGEEAIKKRLKRAGEEVVFVGNYGYIVVNDKLDEAVEDVHHIIQSVHLKKEESGEFLETLLKELKEGFSD